MGCCGGVFESLLNEDVNSEAGGVRRAKEIEVEATAKSWHGRPG